MVFDLLSERVIGVIDALTSIGPFVALPAALAQGSVSEGAACLNGVTRSMLRSRRCFAVLIVLQGAELLAAVEQWRSLPRHEIVRRCGYCSVSKAGQERLNYTAFYEALLEAMGLHLGNGRGRRLQGRSGRSLPFHTKVQFNGNLMVGRAYLDLLQAKPGDHYVIRLGRHAIRLQPLNGSEAGPTPDGER